MDNGDKLAFARRTEGNGLLRRRPAAIGGEGLGPRHCQLDRPVQYLCRHRGKRAMGKRQGLRAEAAANEGRDQADILEGNAEPFGIGARHAVEPLAGLPHGEGVALPAGDQAMRLDRHIIFARRGVGRLDAHRGLGKRPSASPHSLVMVGTAMPSPALGSS